jgi:cytochrome c oxidase assembly factor CtaG
MSMTYLMSHPWPNWSHWSVTPEAGWTLFGGVFVMIGLWRGRTTHQRRLLILALAGLVTLLASDIQSRAMMSYQCHMVEHIAVTLVVAPLAAAGLTYRGSKSLVTIYFLGLTVLVPLFHLTTVGGYVMMSPGGHDIELFSFLVVSTCFWLPVYASGRPLSDYQRAMYVTIAAPVIALTGVSLMSAGPADMATTNMRMTMITLGDVHGGGTVMIWGGAALALQGIGLGALALRHHVRRRPAIGAVA